MSVYRTTKCPYCNHNLEYRKTTNELDYMPELLPCCKCGNLFKTGKKLFFQMSKEEKEKTIFWNEKNGLYIKTLVGSIMINFMTFILASLVMLLFTNDNNIVITVGVCIWISAVLITYPKSIEKNRKEFKYWKKMTVEEFMKKHYPYN